MPDVLKELDIAKLEARIVELENALKAITALKQPMDLSADEIKAYLKVRDALACDFHCGPDYPYPCSRCVCDIFSRCTPTTACWVCACSRHCGPGYFGGGLARFTDLGS